MSVHRIAIPELIVPGKRLGRHIHIDDRSANFPAELAPALVSVTHQSGPGLPLNQAETSSCTAHALVGALNTVPHWASGQPVLGEPDAYQVYSAEEILEGFGPYPPNDQGGSGTEVCQAGRNAGWLSAYQQAADINAALAALVLRPVITGINWFTSFDTPDPSGMVSIAPNATVRGGHEIAAIAIDVASELVWFPNSWGTAYGVPFAGIPGGCFCMRFSTWETLLGQGGDVTVPRTAPGWKAAPLPS